MAYFKDETTSVAPKLPPADWAVLLDVAELICFEFVPLKLPHQETPKTLLRAIRSDRFTSAFTQQFCCGIASDCAQTA